MRARSVERPQRGLQAGNGCLSSATHPRGAHFLNRRPKQRPRETLGVSWCGAARTAHCLEAALFAAVVLKNPTDIRRCSRSSESIDRLDHVIFATDRDRLGLGPRSRDPGLHVRVRCHHSPLNLALSIRSVCRLTGRVTATRWGYSLMGTYDWRRDVNVWKVERMLLDWPHRRIRTSNRRFARWRARYRAFRRQHPDRKPVFYPRRDRWTELPAEFRAGDRLSRDRSPGSAS